MNPLCREGDRPGLIGGGLVSACIISAGRQRGAGGGGEGRRGRGERGAEEERVPVEDRVEPPRRRMCQHPLEPEI